MREIKSFKSFRDSVNRLKRINPSCDKFLSEKCKFVGNVTFYRWPSHKTDKIYKLKDKEFYFHMYRQNEGSKRTTHIKKILRNEVWEALEAIKRQSTQSLQK